MLPVSARKPTSTLNSGEGGLLTTNDPYIAARAVIMSGSYMLYQRHGASPSEEVFRKVRLDQPNLSVRLDNLRAAILRPQLAALEANIARWNERYRRLEEGLHGVPGLWVPRRAQHEAFVGSSFQFRAEGLAATQFPEFIAACGRRGVELKWFGDDEPKAFTSRYDSWRYLGPQPVLPQTLHVLAKTLDMRIPLTFSPDDCSTIAEIIADEVRQALKIAT